MAFKYGVYVSQVNLPYFTVMAGKIAEILFLLFFASNRLNIAENLEQSKKD